MAARNDLLAGPYRWVGQSADHHPLVFTVLWVRPQEFLGYACFLYSEIRRVISPLVLEKQEFAT